MLCLLMCVKHRTGVASVDYGELMKQSFSLGPSLIQRFADASRYMAVVMSLFKRFQFLSIAVLSLLTRQQR